MEETTQIKLCPFGAMCETCKLSQPMLKTTYDNGKEEQVVSQECALTMATILLSDIGMYAHNTQKIMAETWK